MQSPYGEVKGTSPQSQKQAQTRKKGPETAIIVSKKCTIPVNVVEGESERRNGAENQRC